MGYPCGSLYTPTLFVSCLVPYRVIDHGLHSDRCDQVITEDGGQLDNPF